MYGATQSQYRFYKFNKILLHLCFAMRITCQNGRRVVCNVVIAVLSQYNILYETSFGKDRGISLLSVPFNIFF